MEKNEKSQEYSDEDEFCFLGMPKMNSNWINSFFFVKSLLVKDGALDWMSFKKNQFLLSPLGYFDVAFFFHAENISASAIILRCTSSQVQ